MKIPDPDIYFSKRIRVLSLDGDVTEGEFYGYNYDYDDGGNEFVEFDVKLDDGPLIGFSDDEAESIEIVE